MNTKTWIAVVASSALAFGLTFTLVPRRPPTWVRPSQFELPGTPVSVDGVPVHDWEEATRVLQRVAKDSYYEFQTQGARGMPTELEGKPVRITYLKNHGGGPFRTATPVTVEVRPFIPVSIDYSRGPMDYHLRYEITRHESIE